MVRINGEDKALAGINLLEYLKDAGYQLEKIVVERNLEIIPRDSDVGYDLRNGQRIHDCESAFLASHANG